MPLERSPTSSTSSPLSSLRRWLALILLCTACGSISRLQEHDDADATISAERIDAAVAAALAEADRVYVRIDEQPIAFTALTLDDDGVLFVFDGGRLSVELDWQDLEPTGRVALQHGRWAERERTSHGAPRDEAAGTEKRIDEQGFDEDGFAVDAEFVGKRLAIDETDHGLRLRGTLRAIGDQERERTRKAIDLLINEAAITAGSTHIEVAGNRARLSGDLGTRSYQQIRQLLADHPAVDTLVFVDVPGSLDDSVNVHTGRLIRAAGLTTRIEANGMAASGGVDLFLAGVRREVVAGARLGVHAWCCDGDRPADELPKEHPAHDNLIAYSEEMLGASGRGFYFFTLQAAHFDGIHWMSGAEIRQWRVATTESDSVDP